MTSSRNELTLEDYTNIRRTVEAPFDERIKQLEVQRHQAIKAFNDAWPSMGGSAQHIARFEAEKEASPQSGDAATLRYQDPATSKFNGSVRRTIPMETVRREVQSVLYDGETEVISQSLIKDRLLAQYPDVELQPLRVAISRVLRQLERENKLVLVEVGKAGAPHKYRKDIAHEVGILE